MNLDSIRLHGIIFLIIFTNIWGMIFPKGMGYEVQTGFAYELSKYIYGIVILLMIPVLFETKRFYFWKMKYMAIYIIIHIFAAYYLHMKFDLSNYFKTLMICISFVYFEDALRRNKLDKKFMYVYVLSIFINITYLTLTQNRFETALENYGHIGGGQNISVSLIFLLPLIFYMFNEKISSYMFLIIALVALVSMRRTAMLAYLFCLPFVYRQLARNVSRGTIIIIFSALVIGGYYVYTNYWFVLQDRFQDMYEANGSGYYASGRTGWWEVLIKDFIDTPQKWIQGFGLGQVVSHMSKAGFPFTSAHNDYLEIGFTYGLIGLYLWFGSMIDLFILYKKRFLRKYSSLIMMSSLSYLIISLVSGATQQPHFICVAIFASLMLTSHRNKHSFKSKFKYKKTI